MVDEGEGLVMVMGEGLMAMVEVLTAMAMERSVDCVEVYVNGGRVNTKEGGAVGGNVHQVGGAMLKLLNTAATGQVSMQSLESMGAERDST